jgi:hypothetical protein
MLSQFMHLQPNTVVQIPTLNEESVMNQHHTLLVTAPSSAPLEGQGRLKLDKNKLLSYNNIMKSPRNLFKDATYNTGRKDLSDHQIDRLEIPDHEVRKAGIRRIGRNALALTAVTIGLAGTAKEAGHVAIDTLQDGAHATVDMMYNTLDAQHKMDASLRASDARLENATHPSSIPIDPNSK